MIKALFAIVVFLGVLSVLVVGIYTDAANIQQTSGLTNQGNTNLTFVNSGIGNYKLCDYQSDIPIFGSLIWGADCIGDYVGTLFGIATISSDNILLGIIFAAIVLTVIGIGIAYLRGIKA